MVDRRRKRVIFAGFALVPILLIAAVAWLRASHKQDLQIIDHSHRVRSVIADLGAQLADAETARRMFIIQGDSADLAGLDTAARQVHRSIELLAGLVQDDAPQRSEVRDLAQIIDRRMDLLRRTAQVGRLPGGEKSVQAEERERGLALSGQIREITGTLTAEEDRLLQAREQRTAASDRELNAVLALSAAAFAALLLWANRTVSLYAQESDKAEAAWAESNRALREKMNELDRRSMDLDLRAEARTARLEQARRDLQQFTYVAGHEFQEPLRMVVSYLSLLEKAFDGKLDSSAQKYLLFASQGAQRMQALIADILTYARTCWEEVSPAPAQLSAPFKEARYSLLTSIRESDAEIIAGPLPEVEIDEPKMSLVFRNLLSNAIKFRKPGERPRIHVGASRVTKKSSDELVSASGELGNGSNGNGSNEPRVEWKISVRDEGIGFDSKYSEKIFGAFQRLHAANKYPGTGIGLALCQRIIEGHGGRIWAESSSGEGATFFFTLPARAGMDSQTTDSGPPKSAAVAPGAS